MGQRYRGPTGTGTEKPTSRKTMKNLKLTETEVIIIQNALKETKRASERREEGLFRPNDKNAIAEQDFQRNLKLLLTKFL